MAEFSVKLKEKTPDKKVEIWAQDEGRIGLQPIVRKVWSPIGERPIAIQYPKYQWSYLYSFVHPKSGDSFWLILPTVNNQLMSLSLKEFSNFVDSEKEIILLLDRAGWHVSKELEIPENIHLFPLPAYTPQLQPVESAWPLLKEPIANRYFENLDVLEDDLVKRCRWLMSNPDIVKGEVGFKWIQEIEGRID